ncbi:SRPBCC family protein [Rhodococcus sp. NPDC003382]|uniref:SRPBCC family protein n=1 Tax=unclassified Rhodococcus (in: high G+C Gram-positive bacteria) TaxID=192944 RepID=UPI0018CC95E9|nr:MULTISPECIES: SRPBCC family protein [unclassified Rhodococcus (in: high G+C Gram-positive bacteria)]MBH0120636.1 SRPBCC family protein [Rhodococcus sp. CX]MCK8672989.1 SRPBCC family protein [Rhodococcus sp. HM1]
MDIGTVSRTYDGRVALRFERAFPQPPEQVWRAITDPDLLATWFPARVNLVLEPGAQLQFSATDEQVRRFAVPADHTTQGTVIAVRPARVLEFMWDADVLHWELVPDGSGGCYLTLTHTTDDEEDAYAHGAGWHAGFEVLEAQLEGRPIDWSPWDRAAELAEHYRNPAG